MPLFTLFATVFGLPLIISYAQTALSFAAGIAGIGFVIAFHELGHFLAGKLFGLNFHSFSIGFGPKIIERKLLGTAFSISLIPLGGYVEPVEGTFKNPEPNTLMGMSYLQKMAIIIGGIAFNIIFAYIAFVGLYTTGIPGNPFMASDSHYCVQQFTSNDAPALKGGLQLNDTITHINNVLVEKNLNELLSLIKNNPQKPLIFKIQRDNQIKELTITPDEKIENGIKIGIIGVAFGFKETPAVPFLQAIKKAGSLLFSLMKTNINAFGSMFKKRTTNGLAGPIAIIAMGAQSAMHSFSLFIILLAYISIGLAVLNLLPLPILDGGQMVSYTIEAIMGRQIHEKAKWFIHFACWIAFLALFLYLSFKDIVMIWFK